MSTQQELAALIAKDREGLESSSVYYPRCFSSPFTLPHAITTHQRFTHPLDAVIWFGGMVRRAEMLTRRYLWGKAMQKRAQLAATAQDKALADWKEAGNDG